MMRFTPEEKLEALERVIEANRLAGARHHVDNEILKSIAKDIRHQMESQKS